MEITRKQNILNLDFEQDSSEEELPTKPKQQQNPVSARFGLNRGCDLKFSTTLIKPGIFCEESDDYYNSAIMTYPEFQVVEAKPQKKVERKPRQITFEEEEQEKVEPKTSSIQILNEIYHESQTEPTKHQEENKQQQKKVEFKDISLVNNGVSGVTSSIHSSLLNIGLDQSQSSSQAETNGQYHQEHSQTIKLLSLKPHEREKVSFEEIAVTHDPFQNIRLFTDKQVEMGKILNLLIYRNQSGLNYLWPQYELFYQTGAPMLYSKKMMGNTTSNYYVTIKKDVSEVNDPYFVAKLRGNFPGSVYQVYSKGVNPKKSELLKQVRSIEATIVFKTQREAMKPREFQVYTLAANTKYHDLQGLKMGEQVGLDQLFKNQKNKGKIFHFQNRKPIYSAAVEGFILNFGGRVQKASIKNFILQDSIAHREVLMLGKLDDDKFRVDVSWPLKPYVGYCICLANFDSKYTSD